MSRQRNKSKAAAQAKRTLRRRAERKKGEKRVSEAMGFPSTVMAG